MGHKIYIIHFPPLRTKYQLYQSLLLVPTPQVPFTPVVPHFTSQPTTPLLPHPTNYSFFLLLHPIIINHLLPLSPFPNFLFLFCLLVVPTENGLSHQIVRSWFSCHENGVVDYFKQCSIKGVGFLKTKTCFLQFNRKKPVLEADFFPIK